MRVSLRGLTWVLSVNFAAACATAPAVTAQVPPAGRGAQGDTLDPNLVPAGFGSLRQDDIAIKVAPSSGLQVRAVPLDERFIRLLSPDSYRAMSQQAASRQQALTAVKERNRLPSYSLWSVSFYALEQGETRFSPQEFIINNTGRDFRPLDVLPISAGFGEYRLRQREVQTAIFVFDGQIDLNQPTSATMEGTSSATDWTRVLQVIERERVLVRSRAAAAAKKP
jgi:hypothetical protein